MAEQLVIQAQARDKLGTRVARRYRQEGKVPAVLARRGEQPIHLLVEARELEHVMKKHARIIDLSHPAGKERVFIREVQYDHMDEHPIHVDFTRVAMDELITLEVPLLLKGKPVGVTEEGGVLDQFVKVLRIQCLPDSIPDHVEADVASLKKDAKFLVKDLVPPKGVKILNEADVLVAIVQEHKVEELPVAAAAVAPGPTEPEVIKKEKEEEVPEEGEKKEAPKKEAPAKEEKEKK